ncbi:myosin heavy chain, non-muscle-like [Artemia franciscana]|uniref:myosin heavy chain, non-muscle-like n=1 Tax=Artemia franciscana TaxID=6661 RepID=UPI0032D9D15F
MEEKVSDLSQALAEEEEKSKHLAELKEKHETSLSDLEERLSKEQIALQESNKEFEALKATTAAEQELRTKREQELALLKKSLEEESGHHESQLMEMRQKHSQELAVLQEQMDNAKKIKEALEKAKATLAAENADMANEIKSIATSKAETDIKRKHLESQVSELTSRLQESEGARSEVQDRLVRMQTDMESLVAQSKQLAELKDKHETSLSDLEERLNKEQIALQESNKEFEALKATTAAEQELRTKREQELALLKKSLEEESGHHESQLMEMRHKHSQELAVLQEQMDNAKKIKEALEKAKATLAAENADMANEIKSIATSKAETDRKRKHLESQVIELEKTQRNFDKILAEEKAISERFASERDAAERDAREKETKLEEYIVKVEELQRSRRVLQNELIRRILHNIH